MTSIFSGRDNDMIDNSDETFTAVVADEVDGKVKGKLKQLTLGDLPDEDVLVRVAYSTLNYKDGLAVSGRGRICKTVPMVCGLDLAGEVIESRNPAWKPGDRVMVNGFGLSEKYWGGYSQKQRLKAEWLVPVPKVFSLEQAMGIGTAGYTAMLCVQAIQEHGVKPGDGPVVVTGAAGGVGSIAVLILSRLGYQVTASTGRVDESEAFLKSLGASALIPRDSLARPSKPLEKETWIAAVDAVGSQTLATVLAQTCYEGIVAACGLAGGMDLPSSVAPFILRGVTLRGIDSVMASLARRKKAWDALAKLIDRQHLETIYQMKPMTSLPELAEQIIDGRIQGRIVIDVNA